MIRRVFHAYGVDFNQWKVIIRTSIRLANRQSSVRFDATSSRGKDMNYSLILSALIYAVMGLMMSGFVFQIPDPFWSSLFIFTTVAFMIGSLMLIEFGAIVVAPEDYHIFSVQPVSSRTYFAAKITFTLLYVLLYILALGLPSVVAFGFAGRTQWNFSSGDPVPMAAALLALLMVGIVVAMSMILLYATTLKYVHFRKLKRVLSYLQLVMSFIVYGSYALLPSFIMTLGANLPRMKPWWIYLLPTSWYSVYLNLAMGSFQPASVVVAIVGAAFAVGVIPIAFSKISLSYAESLSEASTVPEEKGRPETIPHRKAGMLFQRYEDRAIASLIRNQFKHDTRFRLAILGIIPLTILYILMGLKGGGKLFDPFNPDWKALSHSALLYVVIIIFPLTMKEAVTHSESFLASWIFFVTPAEKARLVLSVKRILYWYFIVPYLLVLGLVFQYYFHNVSHVIMHVLVLLLFSYAFLQLYLLINPQMPFSVPRQLSDRATIVGTVVILGPIMLVALLLVLSFFAYQSTLVYIGTLVVAAALTVLMEKLLVRRVARKLARLEFRG